MSDSVQASAAFLSEVRLRIAAGRRERPRRRWRFRMVSQSFWRLVLLVMLTSAPLWLLHAPAGIRHLGNAFILQVFLSGIASHLVASVVDHPHHWPYAFWPVSEEEVVSLLLRRLIRRAVALAFLGVALGFGLGAAMGEGASSGPMAILQGLSLGLVFLPLSLMQALVRSTLALAQMVPTRAVPDGCRCPAHAVAFA